MEKETEIYTKPGGEKINIPKGYEVKTKKELEEDAQSLWAKKLMVAGYKPILGVS